MRPPLLFGILMLVGFPLAAEENQPPSAEIQELVAEILNAANAGNWPAIGARSNIPSLYGSSRENNLQAINEKAKSYSEGITRKLTKVEAVDFKIIKTKLNQEAREFITESDQLIRIRYDEHEQGKTKATGCLLIFRRVRDQQLLAGAIADPAH